MFADSSSSLSVSTDLGEDIHKNECLLVVILAHCVRKVD